jgi:hypothetical protein
MTDATTKTSTVIVVAPTTLNNEQHAFISDMLKQNLPADVGVVVLGAGYSVFPIGDVPATVEPISAELLQDDTNAQILEELRGLRGQLQGQLHLLAGGGSLAILS